MRPPGGSVLRALAAGAAAGTVGGLVLCGLLTRRGVALDNAALLLLAAAAAGGGFALLVRERNPGEALFLGMACGALGWLLGPLTLQPFAVGQPLAWSVVAAQRQFAGLLGYLLYGASTGLAYGLLLAGRSGVGMGAAPRAPVPWPPGSGHSTGQPGRARDGLAGALLRGALAGAIVALLLQVRGGLVVGPLLGLVQALKAPRPSRGFGAALVRGQGSGFLAWLAVLGGASR